MWKIKDSNQTLENLQNKSLDEANDFILGIMMENEENLKYLNQLDRQESKMKEDMSQLNRDSKLRKTVDFKESVIDGDESIPNLNDSIEVKLDPQNEKVENEKEPEKEDGLKLPIDI